MYREYKMSTRRVQEVKIHKHTPVRRRPSIYLAPRTTPPFQVYPLVTDISRVPKDFDNRVLCHDGAFSKASFRKMTKEEFDEFIDSKGY